MNYTDFEKELKKLSKKQLLKFIDDYDTYVMRCSFEDDDPYNVVGFYERFFKKEIESEKSYKG